MSNVDTTLIHFNAWSALPRVAAIYTLMLYGLVIGSMINPEQWLYTIGVWVVVSFIRWSLPMIFTRIIWAFIGLPIILFTWQPIFWTIIGTIIFRLVSQNEIPITHYLIIPVLFLVLREIDRVLAIRAMRGEYRKINAVLSRYRDELSSRVSDSSQTHYRKN